jgi:enoyl-CoA hydratase/carnithine racemase
MEQEKVVLYHTKNKIAFITLNRPHSLNAIDPNMPIQLKEVLWVVVVALRCVALRCDVFVLRVACCVLRVVV